jgi:hypothetical protein
MDKENEDGYRGDDEAVADQHRRPRIVFDWASVSRSTA